MVTVDQLLLAEHLQLPGGEVVGTLQRPRRTEGPARPARALKRRERSAGIKSTGRCSNRIQEKMDSEADLVLDGADGAVLAPVELGGEAVGGEGRRVVRRPGDPLEEAPAGLAEAEEALPELVGGEVGELGDAVHRGGVEPLVAARAAEVGPEHGEPVRVLVGVPVGLAEPPDEAREMRLRVELQLVLRVAPDHLLDEGVLQPLRCRGEGRVEEEDGSDDEEQPEAGASHDWSVWYYFSCGFLCACVWLRFGCLRRLFIASR